MGWDKIFRGLTYQRISQTLQSPGRTTELRLKDIISEVLQFIDHEFNWVKLSEEKTERKINETIN